MRRRRVAKEKQICSDKDVSAERWPSFPASVTGACIQGSEPQLPSLARSLQSLPPNCYFSNEDLSWRIDERQEFWPLRNVVGQTDIQRLDGRPDVGWSWVVYANISQGKGESRERFITINLIFQRHSCSLCFDTRLSLNVKTLRREHIFSLHL